MHIAEYLKVEGIQTDLAATDKPSTLRALARLLVETDDVLDEQAVYDVFAAREELASTGVGSGVAIPHGRFRVSDFRVAVAISRHGVDFDSLDGVPARIFMAVLAPEEHPAGHLRVLARISRVLKEDAVRQRLLAAKTRQEALEVLCAEDRRC